MQSSSTAILELIKARRSTRSYLPSPVAEDVLERVVEAGRYAPSGNNSQTTRFIVVSDAGKLARLREITTAVLAAIAPSEGMPPPLLGMIKRAREGTVDVSYGAPVLILTANKKDNGNAVADCSCALMNMMLMASAEGVGSCWINQYRLMSDAPPLRAFAAELGLAGDEELHGALALGHTDKQDKTPLPRKGNPVNRVR